MQVEQSPPFQGTYIESSSRMLIVSILGAYRDDRQIQAGLSDAWGPVTFYSPEDGHGATGQQSTPAGGGDGWPIGAARDVSYARPSQSGAGGWPIGAARDVSYARPSQSGAGGWHIGEARDSQIRTAQQTLSRYGWKPPRPGR